MTAASYPLARFPLRWYDATFADPALEREFQADEARSTLRYTRGAILLAIVLFQLFMLPDYLFLPTQAFLHLLALRLAVNGLQVLLILATFHPHLQGHRLLIMQSAALLVGLGALVALAILPAPQREIMIEAMVLIVVGIYVVLRLTVMRATLVVALLLAAFDAIFLLQAIGSMAQFVVSQVIMVCAIAIGLFSSYAIERQRRVAYVGRRQAELQARALEQTAHRAAEAQLRAEQAARVKTDFVAHVSHELRTPLNAVIGFGELLERQIFGPLGNPKYIEYAHDIRESGQHLLSLINDVLDLSKIEAGRMELNWESLVPQEVVRASLVLVSAQANARRTPIRVEVSDDLPLLRGDARAIKQILVNLLSNALKFTPSGGDVRVAAEVEDDGVLFTVSDDGPGMTPAEIEIALTPFGQVSGMVAQSERGTGLGLALANRLAELHGHPLEIRSVPGRGTRVSFRIPRSEGAQPRLL
jgi:two-component system cell cycle sensor histidine kinase PleC